MILSPTPHLHTYLKDEWTRVGTHGMRTTFNGHYHAQCPFLNQTSQALTWHLTCLVSPTLRNRMTGQVQWIKPVVFGDPGGPLDAPTPRTHRVIVRLCLSGPQVRRDPILFLPTSWQT